MKENKENLVFLGTMVLPSQKKYLEKKAKKEKISVGKAHRDVLSKVLSLEDFQ